MQLKYEMPDYLALKSNKTDRVRFVRTWPLNPTTLQIFASIPSIGQPIFTIAILACTSTQRWGKQALNHTIIK
jgi:hypothetical protein